jgi:hypothetical protein
VAARAKLLDDDVRDPLLVVGPQRDLHRLQGSESPARVMCEARRSGRLRVSTFGDRHGSER